MASNWVHVLVAILLSDRVRCSSYECIFVTREIFYVIFETDRFVRGDMWGVVCVFVCWIGKSRGNMGGWLRKQMCFFVGFCSSLFVFLCWGRIGEGRVWGHEGED